MDEYNCNMFNSPSKQRETTLKLRIQETINNINLDKTSHNRIEIQKYNLTNIFEENSFLLQIKRTFEHQADQLSAIHCTNIIDKLPELCDLDVYRLHVKWFYDEFIVYAADYPSGIKVASFGHLQRQIQEQLHQHQIYMVGLIENPLSLNNAVSESDF